MFFKKIPDPQKSDPGDQAKQVLHFRTGIIEKREVLFKDIKSTAEWESVLEEDLHRYSLGLMARQKESGAPNAAIPLASDEGNKLSSSTQINAPSRAIPSQLTEALEKV